VAANCPLLTHLDVGACKGAVGDEGLSVVARCCRGLRWVCRWGWGQGKGWGPIDLVDTGLQVITCNEFIKTKEHTWLGLRVRVRLGLGLGLELGSGGCASPFPSVPCGRSQPFWQEIAGCGA